MQKEILFDELTRMEVAYFRDRIDTLTAEIEERRREADVLTRTVKAMMVTTARVGGCGPSDMVDLNAAGTGVVVVTMEVEPVGTPNEPEVKEMPVRKGKVPPVLREDV